VIIHRTVLATTAAHTRLIIRNPTNVIHHLIALATTAVRHHHVIHHLIVPVTTAVDVIHHLFALATTAVHHDLVITVPSATAKLWVFAALVTTVFIVILSAKTAVDYHLSHRHLSQLLHRHPSHRHLSPLLHRHLSHRHLSHQHHSVTKSVTKNVIVIVDPRVVVKEERVDITEDVDSNNMMM